MANGGSNVGSIGVVALFPNVKGLLNEKLGISMTTITSGKWKDAGSPFREMSEAERKRFQQQINAAYQQFFNVVRTARLDDVKKRMTQEAGADVTDEQALEKLRTLAEGQVFLGKEAYDLGLIDKLGDLHDAEAEARRLAGLPPDAPRITPERGLQTVLESIAQSSGGGAAEFAEQLTRQRIEYLYAPGGFLK
jgi:protease-4